MSILQAQNPFTSLINYKKNNYYFSPDEKLLQKEDIDFSFFEKTCKNFSDLIINLITNNVFIGLPYTNDKEIKYFNPNFIIRTNRSFGMCAGNSKYEALVQGISELLEIYCTLNFYNNQNKKYHCFTKEQIKNNDLLKIINEIESKNN